MTRTVRDPCEEANTDWLKSVPDFLHKITLLYHEFCGTRRGAVSELYSALFTFRIPGTGMWNQLRRIRRNNSFRVVVVSTTITSVCAYDRKKADQQV
eukprot:1389357-Rhodomonas_salina.1